jgi:acylphosphatase
MSSKRVIFEGRVQGVGFRYATKEIAFGYDVCGWVKNVVDGSVEMHVMGEDEEVEEFLKHITDESPISHHIKNLTVEDIPPLENAVGFRITSS